MRYSEGDGNLYALEKHLDKIDRAEEAFKSFFPAIEDMVADVAHEDIEEVISDIKREASYFEYKGSIYDFSDDEDVLAEIAKLMHRLDEEPLSNCCEASFIPETTMCSKCKEHSEVE